MILAHFSSDGQETRTLWDLDSLRTSKELFHTKTLLENQKKKIDREKKHLAQKIEKFGPAPTQLKESVLHDSAKFNFCKIQNAISRSKWRVQIKYKP